MYRAIHKTPKMVDVLYSSNSLYLTIAYANEWLGYPIIWGTNGVERNDTILYGYDEFNDGCLEVIWEKTYVE